MDDDVREQFECTNYQINSSAVFTWRSSNFLITRHSHRFTLALGNLFSCPNDPRNFVNSDIYTSPLSVKKGGDSTSDATALCPVRYIFTKSLESIEVEAHLHNCGLRFCRYSPQIGSLWPAFFIATTVRVTHIDDLKQEIMLSSSILFIAFKKLSSWSYGNTL